MFFFELLFELETLAHASVILWSERRQSSGMTVQTRYFIVKTATRIDEYASA